MQVSFVHSLTGQCAELHRVPGPVPRAGDTAQLPDWGTWSIHLRRQNPKIPKVTSKCCKRPGRRAVRGSGEPLRGQACLRSQACGRRGSTRRGCEGRACGTSSWTAAGRRAEAAVGGQGGGTAGSRPASPGQPGAPAGSPPTLSSQRPRPSTRPGLSPRVASALNVLQFRPQALGAAGCVWA